MAYYSRSCGFVQVSPDNATWYDISGVISDVEADEAALKTAESYTSVGNLLVGGKVEPTTIKLTGVYSNNALEGYNIIQQTVECGGRLSIRWGTEAGKKTFIAENCRLLGLQKPGLNARDPLAMMWGFKVLAPQIESKCIAPTGIIISGLEFVEEGVEVTYTLEILPDNYTPAVIVWSPEPESGQGTTTAIYKFYRSD